MVDNKMPEIEFKTFKDIKKRTWSNLRLYYDLTNIISEKDTKKDELEKN